MYIILSSITDEIDDLFIYKSEYVRLIKYFASILDDNDKAPIIDVLAFH